MEEGVQENIILCGTFQVQEALVFSLLQNNKKSILLEPLPVTIYLKQRAIYPSVVKQYGV